MNKKLISVAVLSAFAASSAHAGFFVSKEKKQELRKKMQEYKGNGFKEAIQFNGQLTSEVIRDNANRNSGLISVIAPKNGGVIACKVSNTVLFLTGNTDKNLYAKCHGQGGAPVTEDQVPDMGGETVVEEPDSVVETPVDMPVTEEDTTPPTQEEADETQEAPVVDEPVADPAPPADEPADTPVESPVDAPANDPVDEPAGDSAPVDGDTQPIDAPADSGANQPGNADDANDTVIDEPTSDNGGTGVDGSPDTNAPNTETVVDEGNGTNNQPIQETDRPTIDDDAFNF